LIELENDLSGKEWDKIVSWAVVQRNSVSRCLMHSVINGCRKSVGSGMIVTFVHIKTPRMKVILVSLFTAQ
jgi:hypothetical protein